MEPLPYGSSYEKLLARVRKGLRDQNISEEVLALLENSFEKALSEQKIILSRKERDRFFQSLSKEILAELLNQFDKS